ncbi:hypothetical protein ACFYV7_20850 [Nocardia suismassiliense]|uniref:Uncharacterized protein n=1 Tax=Nocardia suismassiliense TaxID=2077092 RepID=A0ABW6QVI6_9NOCA
MQPGFEGLQSGVVEREGGEGADVLVVQLPSTEDDRRRITAALA